MSGLHGVNKKTCVKNLWKIKIALAVSIMNMQVSFKSIKYGVLTLLI